MRWFGPLQDKVRIRARHQIRLLDTQLLHNIGCNATSFLWGLVGTQNHLDLYERPQTIHLIQMDPGLPSHVDLPLLLHRDTLSQSIRQQSPQLQWLTGSVNQVI